MDQLTSWETAERLLGKNFIRLDEALKIFPCRKDVLIGYETIPFSEEVLFHCSDPDNPFVLVPGLQLIGAGNRPLTIVEMKKYFLKTHPNLFAQCDLLDDSLPSFVNNNVCQRQWYLLSKKVVGKETIDWFFIKRFFVKVARSGEGDLDPTPWTSEKAVVYIYAWILFWQLRGEDIFSDAVFKCADIYSTIQRTKAYLAFIDRKIILGEQSSAKITGLVPSIKTYVK